VWSGRAALERGLVDPIGGFRDAIAKARELGGIEADAPVRLIRFPARRSGFEALDGFFAASEDTARALALVNALGASDRVRALVEDGAALQSGQAQARMPAITER